MEASLEMQPVAYNHCCQSAEVLGVLYNLKAFFRLIYRSSVNTFNKCHSTDMMYFWQENGVAGHSLFMLYTYNVTEHHHGDCSFY